MQLRKTCNHPDLVQPKSTLSGFVQSGLKMVVPSRMLEVGPEMRSTALSLQHADFQLTSLELQQIQNLLPKHTDIEQGCLVIEELAALQLNKFNRDLQIVSV